MMRWLPIAIFAVLIALLAGVLQQESTPHIIKTNISPMVGKHPALPNLPKLAHNVALTDAVQSDEPVILNLFASWCVPCLAEHPLLKTLHKNGTTILGIGWRDSEENIIGWLSQHGNPFSAVWLDEQGDVAIPLGLRGVPETYIIHKGEVLFHHAGVLTKDLVAQHMKPLLEGAQ